ncbi:hypothetical protein HK405_009628 [Cladochytrium tenue]|nr:hypothetical protein HK405_009628 [Cladochytrium tenue]
MALATATPAQQSLLSLQTTEAFVAAAMRRGNHSCAELVGALYDTVATVRSLLMGFGNADGVGGGHPTTTSDTMDPRHRALADGLARRRAQRVAAADKLQAAAAVAVGPGEAAFRHRVVCKAVELARARAAAGRAGTAATA